MGPADQHLKTMCCIDSPLPRAVTLTGLGMGMCMSLGDCYSACHSWYVKVLVTPQTQGLRHVVVCVCVMHDDVLVNSGLHARPWSPKIRWPSDVVAG